MSVRPTLTSAARATSSSSLAWVSRRRSAVLADSAFSRSALASWLSTDSTAAVTDSPVPDDRKASSWARNRTGSMRLIAASISSPRLAISQLSSIASSRRPAMSVRRSLSGPSAAPRTVSRRALRDRWALCTNRRHGSLRVNGSIVDRFEPPGIAARTVAA